jgi:hypothetical protein
VEQIQLAEHNVRGNGPMVMMETNNRQALEPILRWMDASVAKDAYLGLGNRD